MKKFENYRNNLRILATAKEQDLNNEFIVGGIIDKFYIQFELGWKVLKELLAYEGVAAAKNGSPREIIKEAYQFYTCIDEDVWLDMLAQRNNSAHIYNALIARELTNKIILDFVPAFQALESSIESRYKDILETL
jgi:nucleotidyltransferase substrate binding protein (TIGR01987 family)